MYNPVNRVLKATKDTSRYKVMRPHWSVTGLEIAAFLSFFPGMFVFLYVFILSAASLFSAFEIGKGNYVLATILFIVFNIIPGFLGLFVAITDESKIAHGMVLFVIYGGLGIWGIIAVIVQRRVSVYAP